MMDAFQELESRMTEAGFSLPPMGRELAFAPQFTRAILVEDAENMTRHYANPEMDEELLDFSIHLLLGFANTWREIDNLPEVLSL